MLPGHTHCIWTLPPGDAGYSGRWQALKKAFSKALPATEPRSAVRVRRNERGIWQRRFWEHTIRDERDHAAHMDYVHFNPVKHGLAMHPAEWPFSSFRRCVAAGLYADGWCGGRDDLGNPAVVVRACLGAARRFAYAPYAC